MPRSELRPRRRVTVRAGGTAAALIAVVALAACSAGSADRASGPTTSAAPTPATVSPSSSPNPTLPPLPDKPAPLGTTTTAAPVRLQVPAIGVDTGLESLGLVADGSMAPPSTFPEAGWYAKGVRPGDPGPAIIAGHVDSYQGPAVFYDLSKLAKGDTVVVTRADKSVVRFVVDSKAQYPKAHFPTADVYGPTPTPELRLITCTGIFDRSVRSYEDNLVVTAVLVS